jgi:enoyl-CoA hydratase
MTDVVVVETEGPIATVILNRPDKLNAMNLETWRRVAEIMPEVSQRNDLRCVVMRGAGDKAFAAGADISEFENERKGAAKGKAYGAVVEAAFIAIAACRHPTIALIKGACIGGGLEIAARCDIRICGESSTFGIPSNRLGLVIAYPELEGLISLVGRGNATEIVLTGAIFGAADAFAKGLVNRVVADEAVEEEAYRMASGIAERAPFSNRWHKKAMRRLADPTPLTEAEHDDAFACYDSEDFRAGYEAFRNKTKPVFSGR